MDAYEATKMVFSRIQTLDPDNAATVMGILLIQDPGQQDMIRLAFGPDSLLRTVIANSIQQHQQGAQPPPSPTPQHYFPSPTEFDDDQLCGLHNAVVGPRGAISAAATAAATDGGRCLYFLRGYCKNGPSCRFFHHGTVPPPLSTGGGINSYYGDETDEEYFSQQQQQRLPNATNTTLLGSPRLTPTSQQQHPLPSPLAAPSPKSLAALNHLLRLQQLQNHQRAEDEDAAALRLLGMRGAGMNNHNHLMYPTPDMLSPASRQIYLTFPADSTFTEEDVSNYFSIYGPVQDVRIPYQQKRMFGFVSFVYPETVRMVLAKGNPHFVCDSRVLVKPYKEKPKIRENNRKPLMGMISQRSDFSGGIDEATYNQLGFHPLEGEWGSRMLFGGGQDASILLRRKIEEEQQQAAVAAAAANLAALQHAIQLQRKRFTDLQMLDLNNNIHLDAPSSVSAHSPKPAFAPPTGTTSSGFTTTVTPRPNQQLSCNGSEQAKGFISGLGSFSTEELATLHSATSEKELEVSDTLKGGSPGAEEDTSEPIHGGEDGLPNGDGHHEYHSGLSESSEQELSQLSLIHRSLSTISEELELLNQHQPPGPVGFQMPRFSAGGRSAV